MGDRDNPLSSLHSLSLNIVDFLIDVLARTVKLGGMDVHDQGFFGGFGQSDSGGVGHPVMGMNDVEGVLFCKKSNQAGIASDFCEHVAMVMGRRGRCVNVFCWLGLLGSLSGRLARRLTESLSGSLGSLLDGP